MSFYVTLPSNASMNFFPGNTIGNYTTKLFNPLDLDGKWEVGLSELMYPISWHIRPLGKLIITDMFDEQRICVVKFLLTDTFQTITDRFNAFFKEIPIRFYYRDNNNTHNKEFGVEFNLNTIKRITMDPQLARVLGFMSNDFEYLNNATRVKSTEAFDLEVLNAFYVYTDIVTHQYVGDAQAKVIRVVALDQDYNTNAKYVNNMYDVPHYVSLERNNIETINISLKNSLGENVPFESGKVTVKLHFKQVYF